MKVTVEQVRDNLAKLTIEVSPEEFEMFAFVNARSCMVAPPRT